MKDGSSNFLRKPWCAHGGSIRYFQPSAKVEDTLYIASATINVALSDIEIYFTSNTMMLAKMVGAKLFAL